MAYRMPYNRDDPGQSSRVRLAVEAGDVVDLAGKPEVWVEAVMRWAEGAMAGVATVRRDPMRGDRYRSAQEVFDAALAKAERAAPPRGQAAFDRGLATRCAGPIPKGPKGQVLDPWGKHWTFSQEAFARAAVLLLLQAEAARWDDSEWAPGEFAPTR